MNDIVSIGEAIDLALTEMKVVQDIPLNAQQSAVFLGVHPRTLTNYTNKGLLKKKVRNGLAGYLIEDLRKLKK